MTLMRFGSRTAWALALGAVAFVPRARGQTIVVGPQASSMSTVPGASITVPFVADLTSSGGASLGSVAARLTWRTATLHYVGASLGTLGAPVVNADSAATGILHFAAANASGATGMPVLINVTFQVAGAAGDTTSLGVAVSEITGAGTFANLLPATTTTTGRFCVSTGLWGDVDTSATLTSHDALILVTNAVGLPIAPFSLANGDVDGNGVADTRDALIVLSYAVGLPTTSFRAGRLNTGSCVLRSAASVQIQPRTPGVSPGDRVPLAATVKDSTGAIVQGIGLVWGSKDTTVMRADAAGNVLGVAAGSTYAFVSVSPGVKDSVPVVVSGVRHVWYVNPAVAAANLGVELGSQTYPFSTIDTAVVRAAANDTVHVATADYGPVRLRGKALVLLGDSGAGGFPRLSDVTGPAVSLDSVLSGTVEVRGFRLLNSAAGLVSAWVNTLVLGAISVEGVHGQGIGIHATDSLLLAHSSVVGATTTGIKLDSLRIAVLDHVRADAISRAMSDTQPPLALGGKYLGTLVGDSLTFGTGGASLDSVDAIALRRVRVAGAQGPALQARANAVSIVGSDFSGASSAAGTPVSWDPNSYTVALSVGAGAVQFDSSNVHDNGLFGLDVLGGTTVSLRGDTIARNFTSTSYDAASHFFGFSWLRIAQSTFLNNGQGYVDMEGYGSDSVTVDTTVFDGTNAYVYGVAALRVHGGALRHGVAPIFEADNVVAVQLDSVEVTGNGIAAGIAPAVVFYSADTAVVNGMNAHDNASGAVEAYYSGALHLNGGSFLNNGFGRYYATTRSTIASYYTGETRIYGVTLRDSTDVGVLVEAPGTSRTVVDSSALEGSTTLIRAWYCCGAYQDTLTISRSSLTGFGGTSWYGVDAQYLAKLAVTGSLLDSLAIDGVTTYGVDTTIASGNAIRAWGNAGININYGVLSVDSNAFAGCAPYVAAVHAYQPGVTGIVGNTLTGCGSLAWVEGQYAPSGSPVRVLGNTVTRDTTTAYPGIYLTYGLGYVEVAGNTVLGGGSNGIEIGATYNLDSARVDSNVVRQTLASGIQVGNVSNRLSLTYNLLADNPGAGLVSYSPFTATYNSAVRNLSSGVIDNTSGGSSFRFGNVVGNAPFGVATTATSMAADSNWWGDISGPRCDTCTATGDSISANVAFVPYDSAVVALAPPIPAPPAVRVFRPLAARSLAAPRAPQSPVGVLRPGTAPRVPLQSALRASGARPPRPVGRQPGHHTPAWKTGVQP